MRQRHIKLFSKPSQILFPLALHAHLATWGQAKQALSCNQSFYLMVTCQASTCSFSPFVSASRLCSQFQSIQRNLSLLKEEQSFWKFPDKSIWRFGHLPVTTILWLVWGSRISIVGPSMISHIISLCCGYQSYKARVSVWFWCIN
jgi:hypothetical protein